VGDFRDSGTQKYLKADGVFLGIFLIGWSDDVPKEYSDESNLATIRISEAIQKYLNSIRPTPDRG